MRFDFANVRAWGLGGAAATTTNHHCGGQQVPITAGVGLGVLVSTFCAAALCIVIGSSTCMRGFTFDIHMYLPTVLCMRLHRWNVCITQVSIESIADRALNVHT